MRLKAWFSVLCMTPMILMASLVDSERADAAELIMFESATCEWCELWTEEVGEIYAKTEEGRLAPLRRIDKFDRRPAELKAVRGIVYTPTFVLWDQGQEVGRITGYPGEDSFWGLLGVLVGKLGTGGAKSPLLADQTGAGAAPAAK